MRAEATVQRQLGAYNARGLARFVAEYHDDVCVFRPPTIEPVLAGKAAFAKHCADKRVDRPALQARLVNRTVAGRTVVDHEPISGLNDEALEAIAVYEVIDGRIRTVWLH